MKMSKLKEKKITAETKNTIHNRGKELKTHNNCTYVLEALMAAAANLPAVYGAVGIGDRVARQGQPDGAVLQRRGSEQRQAAPRVEDLKKSGKKSIIAQQINR